MIKAVLFDLDGTLVNSLEDLAASTNYALEKFGFSTYEAEKYKYFVGDGLLKLIERVLPEDSRSEDNINKLYKTFWEHYSTHYVDKTTAYDGIPQLLADLKQKGYKLGVISNKPHAMALDVVSALLGDNFDVVYGKLDGYPTKPDPALTLKVMGDLEVLPKESVFIGDSGMDAANAVNAGCIGIGVLWGFRTEDELRSCGADYIVSKPCEILNVLEKL